MKMQLAREIVSIFHSPDDAEAAQKRWDEVFRSGSGVPEDIPEERWPPRSVCSIFCGGWRWSAAAAKLNA